MSEEVERLVLNLLQSHAREVSPALEVFIFYRPWQVIPPVGGAYRWDLAERTGQEHIYIYPKSQLQLEEAIVHREAEAVLAHEVAHYEQRHDTLSRGFLLLEPNAWRRGARWAKKWGIQREYLRLMLTVAPFIDGPAAEFNRVVNQVAQLLGERLP